MCSAHRRADGDTYEVQKQRKTKADKRCKVILPQPCFFRDKRED